MNGPNIFFLQIRNERQGKQCLNNVTILRESIFVKKMYQNIIPSYILVRNDVFLCDIIGQFVSQLRRDHHYFRTHKFCDIFVLGGVP